ncbi:hypothetical protein GCM10008949_46100 [Deinococcus humi]|nr:hypothetical protein GCM10008949_46100 [Deinococcus humi]
MSTTANSGTLALGKLTPEPEVMHQWQITSDLYATFQLQVFNIAGTQDKTLQESDGIVNQAVSPSGSDLSRATVLRA